MTTWYYTASTTSSTSFNFDYVEFRIETAPPPIPPALLEAVGVFGLTIPIESFAVVQKRYRELAKQHHPDAGGDPERMKAINAAFDLLKAQKP